MNIAKAIAICVAVILSISAIFLFLGSPFDNLRDSGDASLPDADSMQGRVTGVEEASTAVQSTGVNTITPQPSQLLPPEAQTIRQQLSQRESELLEMVSEYEEVKMDRELRANQVDEMKDKLASYSEALLPIALEEMSSTTNK